MISALDRAHALGRVMGGVVHEAANTLNTIAMNAQLASISPEDVDSSVQTIIDRARSGGDFLKQLSAFANVDGFVIRPGMRLAESLELARRLAVSSTRRRGVEIAFEPGHDIELPLDRIAIAVAVALLIHSLSENGARNIRLATRAADDEAVIEIQADGADRADTDLEGSLEIRLAKEVCMAHDGAFVQDPSRWQLQLSR